MNKFLEQYNTNKELHHFYILEGDQDFLENEVFVFLDKQDGIDRSDKSLFYNYSFDRFFVEDSRNISLQSQIKTPMDKKMVFVIYANHVTHQAQNALLKILEEPTERTYFFLVLPRVENILPTLISRSVLIKQNNHTSHNTLANFRKMTAGDRIKFVDDLVKDIKSEKKEKIEAQNLVRNLIVDFENEILEKPNNIMEQKDSLKILMKIEDYLNDSGSSTKILLERAVLLI